MIPQGKAVLIKPEDNPEQTDKGIVIPKTVKEKPNIGIVVSAAPGCELVKKGDKVQYERKGASIMTRNGEELHWIIEDQIFYIYG